MNELAIIKPNRSQIERLTFLAYEANAIGQAVAKILDKGFNVHNPRMATRMTNQELLEREIANTRVALELLERAGDVDPESIGENFFDGWFDAKDIMMDQPERLFTAQPVDFPNDRKTNRQES